MTAQHEQTIVSLAGIIRERDEQHAVTYDLADQMIAERDAKIIELAQAFRAAQAQLQIAATAVEQRDAIIAEIDAENGRLRDDNDALSAQVARRERALDRERAAGPEPFEDPATSVIGSVFDTGPVVTAGVDAMSCNCEVCKASRAFDARNRR